MREYDSHLASFFLIKTNKGFLLLWAKRKGVSDSYCLKPNLLLKLPFAFQGCGILPREPFTRDTASLGRNNWRNRRGFQSEEVWHCHSLHPEQEALFEDSLPPQNIGPSISLASSLNHSWKRLGRWTSVSNPCSLKFITTLYPQKYSSFEYSEAFRFYQIHT